MANQGQRPDSPLVIHSVENADWSDFQNETGANFANNCQVGPYQAYRLLKSMEEKGLLIAKGQKKARYYERRM